MNMKLFVILTTASYLLSCNSSNNEVDAMLEKDFLDSVVNSNATFYESKHDMLIPTRAYFVNAKIRFLKFQKNPEAGFSTTRVYFSPTTDSINKIVLRTVETEWKASKEDIFDEYIDTVHIVLPKENLTYTYVNNTLIDSTYRQDIINNAISFIYKVKQETEKEYNSK